jgi:hypothetical protein
MFRDAAPPISTFASASGAAGWEARSRHSRALNGSQKNIEFF